MPSEKTLSVKRAEVAEIAEDLKNSVATVIVDSRGLTVEEDTALRADLRKAGVKFRVRKNTLTAKAAAEVGIEGLDAYLSGPTAIATSDSYTDAAKILIDYAKKYKNLEIKCGIVDGETITAEKVENLAKIPSREGLLSMLLGALTGNMSKLAVAVKAVAEQKQEQEA